MLFQLEQTRAAVVREHIAAENRQDVAGALRTFHRPRYEVMPWGGPADGPEAVAGLLGGLFAAFPDFCVEVRRTHHASAAVIVEVRLTGTHAGGWAAVARSGQRIDVPAACVFEFDEDRLMCERVYFDHATLLGQLGG